MPNQNQICKNCRFFDQVGGNNEGECLRYPPQVARYEEVLNRIIWMFPEVNQTDQCGEWRSISPRGNISAYEE